MRPILMSSSSSTASLQSTERNYLSDSNRNRTDLVTAIEKNKSDHELNKNYNNNNNLNDNTQLGIYCTLRSPQQNHQQQQQQQQLQTNHLIQTRDRDRQYLNCQIVNKEVNSINDQHRNDYNNTDVESDEDNLRLLDNTKKESSMLKQIKIGDQHDFDPNVAANNKSGGGNYYNDNNVIDSNRDSDYNNGNKEIFCSTAFLKLKDNEKRLVELPYSGPDSSSSSDEQTTPTTSNYPLDLLSYCTMSKKLKQMITPPSNIFNHNTTNHSASNCELSSSSTSINNLPYHRLKESKVDLITDELIASTSNFGISNNLSSESLKNACDTWHDLTDDDDDDDDDDEEDDDNGDEYINKNRHYNLNRISTKQIENKLNSFCSDNSKSYKKTKLKLENEQQSKDEKLSNLNSSYKTVNSNGLLQKLEYGLNELKKYEKNPNLKQKSTTKIHLKSQSLDRKKKPLNHRTNQISSSRLTNNNDQNNETITTHPSYCTMKRDKNTNGTNPKNRNFQIDFELENKTKDLNPFTANDIIVSPNNDNININGNNNDNSVNSIQLLQHASLTTEAFNILNELDEILANTESAISTTSNLDDNDDQCNLFDFDLDNQEQDNNNLLLNGRTHSPIQSEATTEKIEDCLFELDEYLDEIDRQTPKLYRDSSDDDVDDNKYKVNDTIEWTDDDNDDEYCNQETLKRSKTLPKKLLRRLNATINTEDDNSIAKDKKFMTIDRKVELLQRGHILRNTIAGLRHKIAKVKLKQKDPIESRLFSNTIQSNTSDISNNESKTEIPVDFSPVKGWRRNSMRKTSLINLPDNCQNSYPLPLMLPPPPPLSLTSLFFNNNIGSGNLSNSSITNNHPLQSQQPHQNPVNNTMDAFNNLNQGEIIQPIEQSTTSSSPSHQQQNNNSLPNNFDINSEVRRTLSHNDFRSQQDHQPLDNLNNLDLVHEILNNATLQDSNPMNNNSCTTTENSNLIEGLPRPRQIGRRAEAHPRILSITTETTDTGQRIIINHDRPVSAPAATSAGRRQVQSNVLPLSGVIRNQSEIDSTTTGNLQNDAQQNSSHQQQSRYICSEASSIGSSRNPSPVSIISSTGSSSLNSTNTENHTNAETARHQPPVGITSSVNRTSPLDPDLNFQIQSNTGINSFWPHSFSRILALLCCTLGLFNISRFSVLTVHYGGNFLIQFLILSIIFGIPMFWLQMCLGSKIRSGPVSMWKISPICRGIGLSLCLAQCVMALYSTISLAWILVYFRDAFIKKDEMYKWQEAFFIYRRHTTNFTTTNLTETIADYFNGVVLQRWQLGLGRRIESGGVRFQLAFNLAIIWALVFIILCKGLKSFGKIVLSLTVVPLVLFFIVTCQLLYIIDFSSVQNIFSASDFEDFLVNSKTWMAAAQETFLTWILLSPSVISITSRSNEKDNSKTVLRRDAIIVVLLTLFGLSLAAVFGYACIQILRNYDYFYVPGSFENMDSYLFLFNHKDQVSPILASIPIKWIPHYSSVLGETYRRQSISTQFRESGYEPLRLCTELFPAVVAVAQDQISAVITIMGFLAFLFFGLAQLCATWKPISSALGNSSSSVLLSCVTGLLLGIPFATEMGLSILHYLDLVIGGAWWLPILWTAQIFGVFLIRGRPYNGDLLVNDLKMAGSMSAFLALSWNVLLPIGLVSLSVIQYKVSGSNQFYYWRGKSYFNFWTRKVGGLIQIGFLLIVPITAIVQIYRYLNKGPPDILDRIQNLYRPTQSPPPNRRFRPTLNRPTTGQTPPLNGSGNNNVSSTLEGQAIQDDAPPKYTPPPSYTTATGARLAKIFRQSIRRSVRRILGESSRTRPTLHTSPAIENYLPPEYSTVLTNPSGLNGTENENIEIGPRILYNSNTNRNISSLERQRRRFTDTNIEIMDRNQTHNNNQTNNRPNSAEQTTSSSSTLPNTTRINLIPFSASDVAQILRTNRHERSASALATRVVDHAIRSSSLRCKSSRSVENLVLNAAPLGQSSAIALNLKDNEDGDENNFNFDKRNRESTSVI